MRVIAIGATGFIGRHVVSRLVQTGNEVAVVHRGNTSLPESNHVLEILADRVTLPALRERLRSWSPEVAIDMILSSARQAHATLDTLRGVVKRVVAISSGDVYRAMAVTHRFDSGPLEPVPLTEDSRLRTQSQTYSPEALALARTAYPWIDEEYDKVQVEQAIRSATDLPATIVRLPMVYGPGDPLHRFLPVIKRIQDGRDAILLEETAAQNVPCRGYVENIAHAIALAATSDQAAGRVYNVADPTPYTEAEWTAKVAAATGWHGRVIAIPRSDAPKHLLVPYNLEQHLFMGSSRIRGELGYSEVVGVDDAIRRTVEWESANPPHQVDPAKYDYAAEDDAIRRAGA